MNKTGRPNTNLLCHFIRDASGFSLVEILVVLGIMAIGMLAMVTMQENQLKSSNYLEFQLKKIQLQNSLIGQILNDPDNCACLFSGASPFPVTPMAPGATLTGVNPTQIGRYHFIDPGVCSTATVPRPFVGNQGIDGIKLTSTQLTNIMNISGAYSGDLLVDLKSMKPVIGPKETRIKIPVSIQTIPDGANVRFVSCSSTAQAGFNSCIHISSSPMNWNASVSCPSDHPNAISGNCSTTCRPVTTNTLSGNTQTCSLLSGGDLCVYPGQYTVTARVVCCP